MGYFILFLLVVGAAAFYCSRSDSRAAGAVRSIFKSSNKQEF